MENTKRKYVTPGEVITTGPYRPDQNVTLDGNRIVATLTGISEIYDDSVRVIPLAGKYLPKISEEVQMRLSTIFAEEGRRSIGIQHSRWNSSQ